MTVLKHTNSNPKFRLSFDAEAAVRKHENEPVYTPASCAFCVLRVELLINGKEIMSFCRSRCYTNLLSSNS